MNPVLRALSFIKRQITWTVIRRTAIGVGVLGLICVICIWVWVSSLSRDLPDIKTLEAYQPEVTTRVHAGDGKLIAEFASEHRIFVPYEGMPDHLIAAFVSAEDKSFFEHGGLDIMGIVRAAIRNVRNKLRGQGGLQGASTITQQVAKNMLLTSDQRIERKVREAVIARRMERAFTKEEILELYLNEIYLGGSSYGVASAALNYFNKSLPDLTLSEAALLAAMPKAPGQVNPYRRPEAAKARRDWVLTRMVANGYIEKSTATAAQEEPLEVRSRLKGDEFAAAAYFVEELRRDLADKVGEDVLYQQGLSIRSTLDTRLQLAAQNALQNGLEAYDRRHGYRGGIGFIDANADDRAQLLADIELPGGYGQSEAALVTSTDTNRPLLLLTDGNTIHLDEEDAKWINDTYRREDRSRGLKAGDVILVDVVREAPPTPEVDVQNPAGDPVLEEPEVREAAVVEDEPEAAPLPVGDATIKQIPDAEGALLALDPHTGRILAMAGGYSFWKSQFNRTTQARRQPGSSFKPFVYAAALETISPKTGQPYTPASKILDAPFVECDYTRVEDQCYSPTNYSTGRFYGLSTMRLGLELSRNAMTVRLAQEMGMDPIIDFSREIGLYEELPPYLSMSLGAGEVTVWSLAKAYGVLVNGGKEITPTLFDRVQDREGKTIYRHDTRECENCQSDWQDWAGQEPPMLPDEREQIVDPVTAFQVVHMLEGVVERGTARGIKRTVPDRPLAGKTGTTNDYVDAWFMGFSPDLVVGVFVGFDEPQSLGDAESGGRVAAPIFADFMAVALEDEPAIPFRKPRGVRLVTVDAKTGELPGAASAVVIQEAFRPGTEPGFGSSFSEGGLSIFGSGSSFGDDQDIFSVPSDTGVSIDDLFAENSDSSDTLVTRPVTTNTTNEEVGQGDIY